MFTLSAFFVSNIFLGQKQAKAGGVFPENTVCYTVVDNGVEDGPYNLVKTYPDCAEIKIGPTGTERIEALTNGPDGYVFGINGTDLVKIDRQTAFT